MTMRDSPAGSDGGQLALREYQGFPAGLLERPADGLAELLGGPALIHVPGRAEPPLFVSVLLHGNETTGWEAVRRLLGRFGDSPLPRSLALFVGNVAAAAEGRRLLEGQPDYNRIWRGEGTPEHALAARVRDRMAERGVFASIDIHNNSGHNPHYACINRLDWPFLQLAVTFDRRVVYFVYPETVQSRAFAELAPAVTVECGQAGERAGIEHAADYLEAALRLAGVPDEPIPPSAYELYHTVARVQIATGLSFGSEEGDLLLRRDFEHLNFVEVPAGTPFGWVRSPAAGIEELLEVRDEQGQPVVNRYFELQGGELRTRVPMVPCMLTRNPAIIRQDCLCYLMERLPPLDRNPIAAGEGI